MRSPFGNTSDVVARGRRGIRRARWAWRITLVGAIALLAIAMTPSRSTVVRATADPQPPAVHAAVAQPSTSTAPQTTQPPETEVAGKVVERAPAKVLVDLDEMPRTGSRDDRLVAGAGWILLGVGLLLVDAASALVRRRARR